MFSRHRTSACACIVNAHWDSGSFVDFVSKSRFSYVQNDFKDQPWTLVTPQCLAIRRKLDACGQSLEQLGAKIRLGLATGDNKAFVLDEQTRRRLVASDPRNADIIKPVLGGRDIQRYSHKATHYILLTRNGINVKRDYPTVYAYLGSFGEKFKKRGAKGEHWTNLRACAFFDDFKGEKILWIELTDNGRFSYSSNEEYLLNSAYFLIPPDGISSKFLLGVLNSRTINFYMRQIAATSGMGTLRWINNYVKLFPIPTVIASKQVPIASLVDKVLAAKKKDSNADTSALESEIDQLVYKLYGLTDDEIAIVEGRNETKQEPQGETARRPAASPRRRRQSPVPAIPAPLDDEVLE